MPFNINTGVYTSVAGATTATTGQVIQSAVWNSIHSDLAVAITDIGVLQVNTPAVRNVMESNGCFEIWQRGSGGTSAISVSASSTVYTADRWYLAVGANQAHTVSPVTGLTSGSLFGAQVKRAQGQTGTTPVVFGFPLDSTDAARCQGNIMGLSFAAKAGANFSPTVVIANIYVGFGANPVKQVTGNFSGQVLYASATVALTTALQQFTVVGGFAISASMTQMEAQFTWTPSGTAGANDLVVFDDVNLAQVASTSGPMFPINRSSFELQLMECMRHYEKTFPYTLAPAQNAGTIGALAYLTPVVNAAPNVDWHYRAQKRVTPTVTTFNPGAANANWRNITDGADVTVTVDTTGTGSAERILIYGATVAGASKIITIHATADAGI
jgi:hypothetical protein